MLRSKQALRRKFVFGRERDEDRFSRQSGGVVKGSLDVR